MLEKTRHSHTNYLAIKPFIDAMTEDGAIKCEAPGYMALNFDDCGYRVKGAKVYAMAHNYEQNGDLMADPDMEFIFDSETENVYPISYQQDNLGIYQRVLKEKDGKLLYNVRLLKDLDQFMYEWLRNIKDQGFKPEIVLQHNERSKAHENTDRSINNHPGNRDNAGH